MAWLFSFLFCKLKFSKKNSLIFVQLTRNVVYQHFFWAQELIYCEIKGCESIKTECQPVIIKLIWLVFTHNWWYRSTVCNNLKWSAIRAVFKKSNCPNSFYKFQFVNAILLFYFIEKIAMRMLLLANSQLFAVLMLLLELGVMNCFWYQFPDPYWNFGFHFRSQF